MLIRTLCITLALWSSTNPLRANPTPALIRGSATVIDGDTLRLSGQRIRLWGIDAFEADQTCGRSGQRIKCGREATRHLRRLVRDRLVTCAPRDRDRYGRLIASCTVRVKTDGPEAAATHRSLDLGAEMVRSGWAVAYVRYTTRYQADAATARSNRAGAHAVGFTEPRVWRRAQ